MKKITTILFQAPTFYESIFSDAYEDKFDEDNGGYLTAKNATNEEWEDYKKEVSNYYAQELFDALPLEKMGIESYDKDSIKCVSPKFYNYSSDTIYITLNINENKFMQFYLQEIYNAPSFEEYLKENFTSYDGFMSNHSNNRKDIEWTNPEEVLENVGFIIDYILLKTENGKEIAEDILDNTIDFAYSI